MKIKCGRCSEEHDISQTEPSFAMPDCIADMSPGERVAERVVVSKDLCAIRKERGFVRVLLPIPVLGHAVCNWGVWVETVSYGAFVDIVDAWTDPELLQIKQPAWLANELQTYPGSIRLPGVISFPFMDAIGRLDLLKITRVDLGQREHQLVLDQRDGVDMARKLEWLLLALHPEAGGGP